jgi:hypothetical protein
VTSNRINIPDTGENMKIRLLPWIIAVCFLICGLSTAVSAQKMRLYFNGANKASVKKLFGPVKPSDSHTFYIYLSRSRDVEIKVSSNSVFLSEENECGAYFRLFDPKGAEVSLGDSPAGIDNWAQRIDDPGLYKLKVYMGCLEAFSAHDLIKKKPKLRYELEVTSSSPPAP